MNLSCGEMSGGLTGESEGIQFVIVRLFFQVSGRDGLIIEKRVNNARQAGRMSSSSSRQTQKPRVMGKRMGMRGVK